MRESTVAAAYQPPYSLSSEDFHLLNQLLGSYRIANSRSGQSSTLSLSYRPGQTWQVPPVQLEIAGCDFWIAIPGISAVSSVQELLQGTPWSDLSRSMQLAALDVAFSPLLTDLERAGFGDVLLNGSESPPPVDLILNVEAELETGERLSGQLSGFATSLQWLAEKLAGVEHCCQRRLDHLQVVGELLVAKTELSQPEIDAMEVGDVVLVQCLPPPACDVANALELSPKSSQRGMLVFRGLQIVEPTAQAELENQLRLEIRAFAGRYSLAEVTRSGGPHGGQVELCNSTERYGLYHGSTCLAKGKLKVVAGQVVFVIDGVRTCSQPS